MGKKSERGKGELELGGVKGKETVVRMCCIKEKIKKLNYKEKMNIIAGCGVPPL